MLGFERFLLIIKKVESNEKKKTQLLTGYNLLKHFDISALFSYKYKKIQYS